MFLKKVLEMHLQIKKYRKIISLSEDAFLTLFLNIGSTEINIITKNMSNF